jgi:hypothetical protein
VKFPSSLVKRLRRIDVETRLKGYKYFQIERDFFNKFGVLIDGDFKFGVLLLVFVRLHSYISKLFLTKMQVKFSIFFHRGSLNVIGDKFRFVRSKLKSR